MEKVIESIYRQTNWHWLPGLAARTLETAQAIQQIAAPTFAEAKRAAQVAERFRALGLIDITTDDTLNVYARLPGRDSQKPGLMVSAHTDTVFPLETDLSQRHQGKLIYGPGLGDNSMGVAGMLNLAAVLREQHFTLERDIWFVATSREEGLGDLGGMRAAYARLKDHVAAVINVEGLSFGYIYHAGIAVRRLHITATAPGGHSWLHFGRPSAIHGIVQLGARITAIKLNGNPRTTYNIGIIEGGQSINSIAASAGIWLDMRSERRSGVEALEREVRTHIDALTGENLSFTVEVVGDRPAGQVAPGHPLIVAAQAALRQVGTRPSLETGSTDGNIPLAHGCPTVTIGITRGGNAHRLDEYIETEPVAAGMQQLILLTLAVESSIDLMNEGK